EISRKTKHNQFNRHILKDIRIQPHPRKINPGGAPPTAGLYVLGSGMMVENTTHYAMAAGMLGAARNTLGYDGYRDPKTHSYALAAGMLGHARNTIGFVGYCDPETPGGELLATKPGETFVFKKANVKTKLKARVERFELSGHADREDLREFAVQANPRSIVL